MSSWQERALPDLLSAFGLDLLPEHEFPTDGWSGATFTTFTDIDGRRFVLKRTSLAIDWIARATRDERLREGWVAAAAPWLTQTVAPYLGAAADAEGVAILMPDLSNELIAWERPGYEPAIDDEILTRVLNGVAWLHASMSATADHQNGAGRDIPWCPLPERLMLLTPGAAARYSAEGNPVGERFAAGWEAFMARATDDARELIAELDRDVSPLVAALGSLPAVGLHGDLKLANVALLRDDVEFIDWQMTIRAPIAVELGWFLVSNSGSLPTTPDRVLERYRSALALQGDTYPDLIGDWEAQRDLTWIVGLLLRGWRKGLDAETGVVLPSGVSAADDLAWWSARAVEAGALRL
jgi:phosphotransferase family enzyme